MKSKLCLWAAVVTLNPEIAVCAQAASTIQFTASVVTVAERAGTVNLSVQHIVPILNCRLVESLKNFRVLLNNPTVGAVLDPLTNATASITDNDVGIQFAFVTYSLPEDADELTLQIVSCADARHDRLLHY